MIKIKIFTFNLFYENTYILYDETKECVIIDPGCSNEKEESELSKFIEQNELKPVKLLNTHCHIDHILGNRYIAEKYKLELETAKAEEANIIAGDVIADMYGMKAPKSPKVSVDLKEGDSVIFGSSKLKIISAPGHSVAHIVFYSEDDEIIIGGDVLFRESIGRTDLPGGDFNTLIRSINEKIFVLDDKITIYPGHGPSTTIGYEKKYNPFLAEAV